MDFKFAADVVYEHTNMTHIIYCFYVNICGHDKNANIVGYVWQL
jgi:hypothetical protein